MRAIGLVLLLALGAGTTGCDQLPTNPNTPADLSGTWRGSFVVSGAAALMTWTLTQTGANVNGPVVIALPTGAVLMNGVVAGTVAGSALTYTLTVPAGGIVLQPACSGQITGTATIAGRSTMNGTYTVAASTCPTGIANGTFTLTRQ